MNEPGDGVSNAAPPSRRRSPSPAITRAARILSLLAQNPQQALGASELSRQAGVPKSTVLNLCAAMVDEHFLRRVNGGFLLHHRLAELGTAYLKSLKEVEEFYTFCRTELPAVPQTVQLGVLADGLSVVFLARHDGQQPLNLGLASEIGRSVPAHCTATGKALLAAASVDALSARLPDGPLPTITTNSLSTAEELAKELDRTRERGFSVENGEVVLGLRCVGVAIRTPHRSDELVGISFTYPVRYITEDLGASGSALREFAGGFASRIGGQLAF